MAGGGTGSAVFSVRLDRSLIALVILVLAGIVLRAWGFSRLGLVHFDEGVYSTSGLQAIAPTDGAGLYPKQMLYSPPLYVYLVGLVYRISGEAPDQAAILASMIMGVATIALIWWIAGRWFGPEAGIAAAALAALSDYHIAYSRMALTDVTFGFFFLLSLAFIIKTWETGRFRWAILSGLAVGAAWNTKYHGWLPLAVAFLTLVAFAATGRHDRSLSKRLLMCWLAMSAVAAICYLPWLLYVETERGGYLALMRYQRSFLSLYWLKNLWRHAGMQWYMDGWLSRLSPIVACLLALVIRGNERRLNRRAIWLVAPAMLCSGIALGGAGTAAALAVLSVALLLRRGAHASWILLCSLAVLWLSTPFYRPYSRLLMPLVLTTYLIAGAGIRWTLDMTDRAAEESTVGKRPWPFLLAAGAGSLVILSFFVGIRPTPRTWMATDSVRRAVTAMLAILPEESTVFVHGAPEVAFYFLRAKRRAIPIDDPIDHPNVTVHLQPGGERYFLVTGIYSQREPRSRASLKRLASQLHLAGIFPIEPNEVRLLDDFTPAKALQFRLRPSGDYDLRLYRIDPAFLYAGNSSERKMSLIDRTGTEADRPNRHY